MYICFLVKLGKPTATIGGGLAVVDFQLLKGAPVPRVITIEGHTILITSINQYCVVITIAKATIPSDCLLGMT